MSRPPVPEITQLEGGAPERPPLLRAAHFLLDNLRPMLVVGMVTAGLFAGVKLVSPREYEVTAAFTPSSGSQNALGAAAGLASQIGLKLDVGGDAVAFYSSLVKSRSLLLRLAAQKYSVSADGVVRSADLPTLLDVDASDPRDRREAVLRELLRMIVVRSDPQANIIEVKVTSRYPELSEQMAAGVLKLVNDFNVERRRSQAAAEREFAQERVRDAMTSLQDAEEALAGFLLRNRAYSNSPELTLQYDRLRRRVDLQQQVLASLLQSLETARIEALRTTPLVTPIDRPDGAAVRKPRGAALAAFLGLFVGAALTLVWASLRDAWSAARRSDPEYFAEVTRLAPKSGPIVSLLSRRGRSGSRS